eukprot:TRINITY_DN12350_c1_g2_i1.p1 TRINITY_DN12350_c1_g2~~TRINITY_DN12350_c1_g2_i1.p1  ORF type:complete len:464 (-),score=95.12 TRINITY_DN12350_c1_g2_i1:115-1449(-)
MGHVADDSSRADAKEVAGWAALLNGTPALECPRVVCTPCATPGCPYRAAYGRGGPLTELKCTGRCCTACGQTSLEETQQPCQADAVEDDGEASPARPAAKSARLSSAEDTDVQDQQQRHEADCPRMRMELLRDCWWVRAKISAEAAEEAHCLVVLPESHLRPENCQPCPVILFLTGKGHVNFREDFLWGGVDVLLRNEAVRRNFLVVAPLPTSDSGLLRTDASGWGWTWDEDGAWKALTSVLQQLGKHVDWHRLYATGLSLGACGVWHLALKYGRYFAAMAPISGGCEWPADSWPSGSEKPTEAVLGNLADLAIRAYQIDIDRRSGHPGRDLRWLAWCLELEEEGEARALVLPGVEASGEKVQVTVRRWSKGISSTPRRPLLELWEAAGPLRDWSCWGDRGDNHCFWYRVYPSKEYGCIEFFLEHGLPPGRSWPETFAAAADDS